MRVSYISDYFVEIPPEHPFPMGKFPALKEILEREGFIDEEDIIAPHEASWDDLRLVHTSEYLEQLAAGSLSSAAERRMGLPWSEALVRRSRLAVQGTINAATMALADGMAANLAGGTHHAFPDHAEGFCVLNDVAVAIKVLQQGGDASRSLVIDLDVHQGNGTAAVFTEDAATYTFSMHGERNYPFEKETSSLDVALPDGTGDDAFMDSLEAHLDTVISAAEADIAFYLAGVDLLAGDRYGRLALTRAGIRRRDRHVIDRLGEAGLPICLLMSGGYAATPEATADLHAIAHREANRVHVS